MKTAYVTDVKPLYDLLKNNLDEDCSAWMVGMQKTANVFDVIVMLAELVNDQQDEWFNHFLCGLRPDGYILNADTGEAFTIDEWHEYMSDDME